MQGIRQCVLQHAFCSNKRRARSDAPYLSRVFRLRHEFVSPGDMQIFASGEAKICYPFGNFNLSSERALPFVVWLSTPHPGPPSEAERENFRQSVVEFVTFRVVSAFVGLPPSLRFRLHLISARQVGAASCGK